MKTRPTSIKKNYKCKIDQEEQTKIKLKKNSKTWNKGGCTSKSS